MTIDQLRQFISVARHLNFSRGADELFLHQSTVSKNISSMEHELGGPLFIRKKNDLRLTDAGKLLYNEAPLLVEKFDFLIKRTENIMKGSFGSLRVTVISSYMETLSRAYKAFTAKYPSVSFDMEEFEPERLTELMDSVLDGSSDIAVVPLGELAQEQDELEKRALYRDDFVVLVSATHPLSGRESVKADELAGEHVLLLKYMRRAPLQLITSRLFIDGLTELKINFIDEASARQPLSHLLLQVESGMGITVLPRMRAVTAGWGDRCIRLEDINVPFDLGVIWRKNNINPSLPMFLQELEPFFLNFSFSDEREY